MLSAFLLVVSFTPVPLLPRTPPSTVHLAYCSRCASAVAILAPGPEGTRPISKPTRNEQLWNQTPESGLRWKDDVVGDVKPLPEEFVKIVTTVSLASSEKILQKSSQVVQLAKLHPMWLEALDDIRVGGSRKVLLLPSSPYANLDETISFNIELVRVETGVAAGIARLGGARNIQLALFLLSFVPYFLPEEIKPAWYQGGDPAAIELARQQAAAAAAGSWATQGLENAGIF